MKMKDRQGQGVYQVLQRVPEGIHFNMVLYRR